MPTTIRLMSEERMNYLVEKFIDHLDHLYLNGSMSEAEYNKQMEGIGKWADATRRANQQYWDKA